MKHIRLLAFMMLGASTHALSVDACTNVMLKGAPQSGIVASARTVDFSIPIKPKVLAVPRGLPWVSRGEDASKPTGARWTNQYGFVAVGASDEENLFLDGINEAGLSAAILWLDEAVYMKRQGVNDVSTFDLVSYIIGQYSSAAQAKAAIKELNVYGNYLPEYKMIIPLHLVVMDANGDSFVAEWINGSLKIYDAGNTEGYVDVLANSPPYDKQLMNLASYSRLSCENKEEYSLTGLPGNSDSDSRFVRSAKLKQCSEHLGGDPTKPNLVTTENEALQTVSVILGRVDKPKGEVVTESLYDNTLSFTRISVNRIHGKLDKRGRSTSKLYFKTPDNGAPRLVDLSKLDFKRPAYPTKRAIKSFYVESPRYRMAQQAIPIPASR